MVANIEIDDELSKIIKSEYFPSREESFAWIWIAQEKSLLIDIQSKTPEFRNHLSRHLRENKAIARDIIYSLQETLIPDNHLSWIVKSHRQASWIERFIAEDIDKNKNKTAQRKIKPYPSRNSSEFRHGIPRHLQGKNRSIAMFDYWAAMMFDTMEQRIRHCNFMKDDWHSHTKLDRLFAWLDDADAEKKRDYFWRWLGSRNPKITHEQQKFTSHKELLIFFDHPVFSDAEKEFFNKEARKSWNQQQRRENSKDKKQCNFVLSDKTVLKLGKLAGKYGLSRTEIVELLIESEAKHERYISDRLNQKALLTTPLE
ncbi:hypothetical protein [Alicycliphilus denitrificans]|uniref:hypothetical protein n=1 Tax=Alicycliphilus denitrificans TaxID=179636 RepID=UPI00384B6540